MMKPLLLFIGGIILGALLSANPAMAQTVTRLFGTYNGAPMALQTDSSGNLLVVGN